MNIARDEIDDVFMDAGPEEMITFGQIYRAICWSCGCLGEMTMTSWRYHVRVCVTIQSN